MQLATRHMIWRSRFHRIRHVCHDKSDPAYLDTTKNGITQSQNVHRKAREWPPSYYSKDILVRKTYKITQLSALLLPSSTTPCQITPLHEDSSLTLLARSQRGSGSSTGNCVPLLLMMMYIRIDGRGCCVRCVRDKRSG